MKKSFAFIIVAGGKGSRFGEKKQFIKLAGRELWRWSAEKALELCDEVILVIPEGENLEREKFAPEKNIKITHGGSERALSVLNGLELAESDYVLVHDAARPFASKKLISSLMEKVSEDKGVIPVLPVADALKRIDGEEISCVDRDGLFITQTPQCFHRLKLIECVRENPKAKDEAEAWKISGHKLLKVEGERLNFKITWPEDMLIARALTEQKITRTGLGYDVHKLVPGRKLILGGINIASNLGLLGHSDADLLTHAIMDAILGAAGLPDIGNLYPANDEKFHDINSIALLEDVMKRVKAEGWEVEFVDAVVIAQVPRLNKYREEIINNLAKFFTLNLKFKSAETLDDAGRGLSMTCEAVATLRRLIKC
ncbi:MAG: 2-C-methyl-D-erythritol 4-phosphate cytidylyltransferase [Synergistaceae bacterium]|nr:2-C-methyl-D-erythritol 4-phosphate cytidylyltransferase [Synergistaceae bacterium]